MARQPLTVGTVGHDLVFRAEVSYSVEGEYLRIRVAIASPATGAKFQVPDALSLPLRYFHDANGELNQPLVELFCANLSGSVIPLTINEALFRDFAFHVVHSAHLLSIRMQLSDETYESIFPKLAKFHTDIIIARLKQMTGQNSIGKGRHAKWTAESLSLSIVMAMRKLKNASHRTYTLVANQLHKEFPEQFCPDSDEGSKDALKKLVARYKLNWEEMKQQADLTDSEFFLSLPPELLPAPFELVDSAHAGAPLKGH